MPTIAWGKKIVPMLWWGGHLTHAWYNIYMPKSTTSDQKTDIKRKEWISAKKSTENTQQVPKKQT